MPFPNSRSAGNRFGDRETFETLQSFVQPKSRIRARQPPAFPLSDDFHAGNRTKVSLSSRIFQRALDLLGQRQAAHKPEPNARVGENTHTQISSRIGSSVSTPLYIAGSSGSGTRHGLPRPGSGTSLAEGRP